MGENNGTEGALDRFFKYAPLALSVATGVFGFYLNVKQSEIKAQQDKLSVAQQEIETQQKQIKTQQDHLALVVANQEQTGKFVKDILSYVGEGEKLKLTIKGNVQREAIIIDLLDATALANVNHEGKTDTQKILHTPLWLALATGNVEALGLIGNTNNRRAVWVNLASASGDATVRMTAMEALARSSASNPVEHLLDIFELSEKLNNSEIVDNAIEQIVRVVQIMEHSQDPAQFRENDDLKPLISRLEALQTSIALAAGEAVRDVDQKTAKDRRDALQRQEKGVKRALAFLRGSQIVAVEPTQPTTDLTNLTTSGGGATPKDIKSLIEGLKSTDTKTRRDSRQELANNINSSTAVDDLLQALSEEKTNYRVRLGVASALSQTKNAVVISNPTYIKALVTLIGDDDNLIRKYASEALMRLTDADTVKLVHRELNTIIANRKSEPPDAVYNAVVVLGTWLRILPLNMQEERTEIDDNLKYLKKQLEKDSFWKNTSALIDEMLRLKSKTRKAATD